MTETYDSLDFLLGQMDAHVAGLNPLYGKDLQAERVSNELLYAVRAIAQDARSALDWTAAAVNARYGTPSKRTPYFPLVRDPTDLEAAINAIVDGMRTTHPNIADAFERHQPYQRGKTELGYLPDLVNVNKHRDFTGQTRTEVQQTTMESGGASIRLSGGARIVIGGNARVVLGGRPIGPGLPPPGSPESGINVDRRVLVDWRFNDPPVSVRRTLTAIARQVSEAVHDVRSSAGL